MADTLPVPPVVPVYPDLPWGFLRNTKISGTRCPFKLPGAWLERKKILTRLHPPSECQGFCAGMGFRVSRVQEPSFRKVCLKPKCFWVGSVEVHPKDTLAMQSIGMTILVGLRSSQAAQDLRLHFGCRFKV